MNFHEFSISTAVSFQDLPAMELNTGITPTWNTPHNPRFIYGYIHDFGPFRGAYSNIEMIIPMIDAAQVREGGWWLKTQIYGGNFQTWIWWKHHVVSNNPIALVWIPTWFHVKSQLLLVRTHHHSLFFCWWNHNVCGQWKPHSCYLNPHWFLVESYFCLAASSNSMFVQSPILVS